MHDEPVAEHVPHDDKVGVLALHAHPVHAEELREERAAMALHYVLQESRDTVNDHRTTRQLELQSKQSQMNKLVVEILGRMMCSLLR